MKPRHLIFLMAVVPAVLTVAGGAVFLMTHPRCEVCGRRYGPLVAHSYRHQTTKTKTRVRTGRISSDELARQRATAPIINSLPPLTDANKNLVLSTQVLVGRWESQDGDQNPVLFDADGNVEIGFVRQNGKWLMSMGTYQIAGERVITKTKHNGVALGGFFTFSRGVLYGSRGPSPRVVWRRVDERGN